MFNINATMYYVVGSESGKMTPDPVSSRELKLTATIMAIRLYLLEIIFNKRENVVQIDSLTGTVPYTVTFMEIESNPGHQQMHEEALNIAQQVVQQTKVNVFGLFRYLIGAGVMKNSVLIKMWT
jgi:hypothetical protein